MKDERIKIFFERRSIRKFLKEDIPEEDLRKILLAGHYAPSAGNLQAREFILIKDPERKKRIAEIAYGQDFIAEAPVVLVVCANYMASMSRYGKRGELYALQDADAATENILLAAHALGYGAVWIGAFDEEKLSSFLDLPHYVRPVAIIPIGKPAEKPIGPGRTPLEEKLHYERWRLRTAKISRRKSFWENPKIFPRVR